MSEYHTPVLLDESVSALVTNPSGIYADVTFGGGGHTAGILSRLNEDGHVIAFDRDNDALQNRIDDRKIEAEGKTDRKLYRKIQEKKQAQGLK